MNKSPLHPRLWLILILSIMISACANQRAGMSVMWEGLAEDLEIKRVTPDMRVRMEKAEEAGCLEREIVKDPEISRTISLFPGGGQFYNGEPLKGVYYMATSIFILPYIIAMDDAEQTAEYLNFKHALEFCEEKLRLTRQSEEARKMNDPMARRMRSPRPAKHY